MNKISLILLCLSLFFNCEAQRLKDLENDDVDSLSTDEARYNKDNIVYTSEREFMFNYIVLDGKDSLKVQFSKKEYGIPEWILVKTTDADTMTVQKIGMKVLPYFMNNTQTGCQFNYYNHEKIIGNYEWTGLIENRKNVWLHPPRHQFFSILEFSPFPFIKMPLKIGKKWQSGLTIGYFNSYQRFNLTWEGILPSNEVLEITDKIDLETAFGKLPCWVVKAVSKSALTEAHSTFYFNEQYGFVKLDHVLFDKRRLIFELVEVKNF